MKWFGCGETGHLIQTRPSKLNKLDNSHPPADGERNVVMRDEENASAALPTVVKVPVTSLGQKSVPIDADRITEVMPSDKPAEGENMVDADAQWDRASTVSVQLASQVNESRNSDGPAVVAEQPYSANIEQNQCSVTDSEDCVFKTPQERED